MKPVNFFIAFTCAITMSYFLLVTYNNRHRQNKQKTIETNRYINRLISTQLKRINRLINF